MQCVISIKTGLEFLKPNVSGNYNLVKYLIVNVCRRPINGSIVLKITARTSWASLGALGPRLA